MAAKNKGHAARTESRFYLRGMSAEVREGMMELVLGAMANGAATDAAVSDQLTEDFLPEIEQCALQGLCRMQVGVGGYDQFGGSHLLVDCPQLYFSTKPAARRNEEACATHHQTVRSTFEIYAVNPAE